MNIDVRVIKALAPLFVDDKSIGAWLSDAPENSIRIETAIRTNHTNDPQIVEWSRALLEVLPTVVPVPFIGQATGGYELGVKTLPTKVDTFLCASIAREVNERVLKWEDRKALLKAYQAMICNNEKLPEGPYTHGPLVKYSKSIKIPFSSRATAALETIKLGFTKQELGYVVSTNEKEFFKTSFSLRVFQDARPYASFKLLCQEYRDTVKRLCLSTPIVLCGPNVDPLPVTAEQLMGTARYIKIDATAFENDLVCGMPELLSAKEVKRLYNYMRHYRLTLIGNYEGCESNFTSAKGVPFKHIVIGGI